MPIPYNMLEQACDRIACGNKDGAHVLQCIAHVARLADDIADGDTEDAQGALASILSTLLVQLPRNPFWQLHGPFLSGPCLTAILGWQAGDAWRHHEDEKTRMFGFVYREAVEHVAYAVAYLTGGHHHARAMMDLIQEVSHRASHETFYDWEVR